jgi:CRP-like cAMP-binding protein
VESKNAKQFKELLRAGRWFQGLPESLQDALLAGAVLRSLAKGEWLFARGDAPDGLYAIVEGAMRVTATAPSGKEVLLALVEPPMWFGEISVLDGLPRTHDGIAEEDSRVVHVPQPVLDRILDEEPRHWRQLGLLVASKLRVTFGVMEDIAVLPTGMRLARRLVMAAERYGDWQDRTSRVVEVRQEQLATMLSVSRQTVNQLLKELESRGLVRLSYGQIEIVDLDGLRAAAIDQGSMR